MGVEPSVTGCAVSWHGITICVVVVGVSVLGYHRARARRDGVAHGRSGAVAISQRFGDALNLNVHIHALLIDGVFAHEGEQLQVPGAPARISGPS